MSIRSKISNIWKHIKSFFKKLCQAALLGVLVSAVYFQPAITLDYVKVFIWPCVIIFTLWLFRNNLPDLSRKDIKVEAGGAKVELSDAVVTQKQDDSLLRDEKEKDENVAQPASSSTNPQGTEGFDEVKTLLNMDEGAHKILVSLEARYEYEKIYRTLFGTQLTALRQLSSDVRGMDSDDLKEYLDKHIELSEGKGFKDIPSFLDYMINNILVLYNEETKRYHITNAGVYFLHYLLLENLLNRSKDW